jgi:hypothetical protein
MFGTLIFIILLASVIMLSGGCIMLALRLGKNFDRMGQDTPPGGTPRIRPSPRRGTPRR